jgi:division protein CdvB (Snf7/Vps24/ESCRT-III family)
VFIVYAEAFLVALFLEYPFRTMAKVVFSPPNKVIRLKGELADELNIIVDEIFNDKEEDEDMMMTSNQDNSPQARNEEEDETSPVHEK